MKQKYGTHLDTRVAQRAAIMTAIMSAGISRMK